MKNEIVSMHSLRHIISKVTDYIAWTDFDYGNIVIRLFGYARTNMTYVHQYPHEMTIYDIWLNLPDSVREKVLEIVNDPREFFQTVCVNDGQDAIVPFRGELVEFPLDVMLTFCDD